MVEQVLGHLLGEQETHHLPVRAKEIMAVVPQEQAHHIMQAQVVVGQELRGKVSAIQVTAALVEMVYKAHLLHLLMVVLAPVVRQLRVIFQAEVVAPQVILAQ